MAVRIRRSFDVFLDSRHQQSTIAAFRKGRQQHGNYSERHLYPRLRPAHQRQLPPAQPQFSMQVSSFHIDIAEVTAGQYRNMHKPVFARPALGGQGSTSTHCAFRDDAAMNFVTYGQTRPTAPS